MAWSDQPKNKVFSKSNPIPDSACLEAEYHGLLLLSESLELAQVENLKVPEVYSATREVIEMESIEIQVLSKTSEGRLAKDLVKWYQMTSDLGVNQNHSFGLELDNFIGLNPQVNTPNKNWGNFFTEHRIHQQLKWVQDDHIQDQWLELFGLFQTGLKDYLNELKVPSSIVHGDLWNGNILSDGSVNYLIDPACYRGHYLVDIAMMEMFGGFSAEFYKCFFAEINKYSEFIIELDEYQRLKVIYNLYHQLNHYNIFGDSYLEVSQSSLRQLASWFG